MVYPLPVRPLMRCIKVSPLACFTTMANPQSGFFQVKIGSTGTEAIRR